jgi:hypothetical protein
MTLRFDDLDLGALKRLQDRIAAAIAGFDTRAKAEAHNAAEAVARRHGFSLAELSKVPPSGLVQGACRGRRRSGPSADPVRRRNLRASGLADRPDSSTGSRSGSGVCPGRLQLMAPGGSGVRFGHG